MFHDRQAEEKNGNEYASPEPHNDAQDSQQFSDGLSRGAPAGAPAERIDAPSPEKIVNTRFRLPTYNFEQGYELRPNEWHEPIYSQSYETMSNMYTPGINTYERASRKRGAETGAEQPQKQRSEQFGKAVRAACLILACAVLSGAVSFGAASRAIEYRINRGDFNVVNQVVLGGSSDIRQNGGLSTNVSTAGTGMSAEEIYIMACTQVLSITTLAQSKGNPIQVVPTAVAGSGFIISSDGYILTNFHVVESAYSYDLPLVVTLNDGTEHGATVIGFDKNYDIALIKISATGLNPAIIANSDYINVGQTVYAVGNPLGDLVYTMTDGIVSARNREVTVEGKTINTFQFSAAVNSGNSGGPVYNTNGEVIGIVAAKPMRSSVEGIGFAIPINDAIVIAAELIEHGYITGRPLMGITAQTVSSAHAEYWGWVVGARIMSITEGSAAERADMKVFDIIKILGDTEVDSVEMLISTLRRYRAGDTTTLVVWRDGEEIELIITFDEDLAAGQARPN